MTARKTAPPAPPQPLPITGGAYIRNADGSLTPEPSPAAPAVPEDAPTAPGHANPEE